MHDIYAQSIQVHDGRGSFVDAYRQLPKIVMFIIGG